MHNWTSIYHKSANKTVDFISERNVQIFRITACQVIKLNTNVPIWVLKKWCILFIGIRNPKRSPWPLIGWVSLDIISRIYVCKVTSIAWKVALLFFGEIGNPIGLSWDLNGCSMKWWWCPLCIGLTCWAEQIEMLLHFVTFSWLQVSHS